MFCTAAALPYLKNSRGRIVGIASIAGRTGIPTRSGYVASKHAMIGFLDSLRIELRGTGVTVTVINPGFVGTGLQSRNLGPDGTPLGTNPGNVDQGMTAAECAGPGIGSRGPAGHQGRPSPLPRHRQRQFLANAVTAARDDGDVLGKRPHAQTPTAPIACTSI